ncbi:MAG: hypothetical protein EXR58_06460 [Chloroflexi bacterium]|nr:hypothetical protein [Chloroflexota bacterium]
MIEASSVLELALVGIAAYLLGSIQFARLLATQRGLNLEQTGSGVASSANLAHAAGKWLGAVAIAGDGAKALIPVAGARWLFGPDWASYVALGVMIGHNWPIWSRFNGGRGMVVTLAAAAILAPRELIGLAILLIPIARRIHDTAPPSAVALLAFPLTAFAVGEPLSVVWCFSAFALISLVRRVMAPPRDRSFRVLWNRLVFDRPDPHHHWTLDR